MENIPLIDAGMLAKRVLRSKDARNGGSPGGEAVPGVAAGRDDPLVVSRHPVNHNLSARPRPDPLEPGSRVSPPGLRSRGPADGSGRHWMQGKRTGEHRSTGPNGSPRTARAEIGETFQSGEAQALQTK